MRVVAYSFFRNPHSNYESERCGVARGRFFVNFLRSLVRAHPLVWNGWELWIYHDDLVRELPYFRVLEKLAAWAALKLIPFGESTSLCGIGGMLERLRPVFDQDVERVVCRDVDSLPMPRDRLMVDECFDRRALAHVIHDSQSHSGFMGGTCAFDAAKFRTRFEARSLEELLSRAEGLKIDYNRHGADQLLLNGYVYPNICTETIVHCAKFGWGDSCEMLAQRVLPVASRTTDADALANHVGGVFDVERAVRYYDGIDDERIRLVKECEAS